MRAMVLLGLSVLACTAPWAQGSVRVHGDSRVAQAAVEKAREAARLATEEASEAGQQTTDSGDVVNPNGDVYVAQDETVEGDVIAISGAARVHGKVKGNVVAIGGSIFLANKSEIAGDVVSFGGTITREPRATVGGSTLELPGVKGEKGAPAAEPAGEPVTEAPPAEPAETPADEEEMEPAAPTRHRSEIVQFGQPVSVGAGELVDGAVVSMGGPVDVDGEVKGDVVSMGGPVDVGGKVHGDVVAIGGPLSLDDEAEVRGDAVAVGGPLKTAQGAKVSGQTVTVGGPGGAIPWGILGHLSRPVKVNVPVLGPLVGLLGQAAAWLGQSLVILILVALVVLVFPRQTETVATTIGQEPARALVYGLVSWLLVLPVLVILLLLIVTWLLVPVYLLALMALLILGYVGVARLVGGRIVGLCNWRVTSLLGLTLVGFVALSLVDLIGSLPFVSYVAAFVTIAVLVFALGGALMTRFGTDPSGTWLGGTRCWEVHVSHNRSQESAAHGPSGDVSGGPPLAAVPGTPPAAAPVEPETPAEDDFDDATRRALEEVDGAGQPEAAEPSDQPDEPPIEDLDEAARNALTELPPEDESEEPPPPAEGDPKEPGS